MGRGRLSPFKDAKESVSPRQNVRVSGLHPLFLLIAMCVFLSPNRRINVTLQRARMYQCVCWACGFTHFRSKDRFVGFLEESGRMERYVEVMLSSKSLRVHGSDVSSNPEMHPSPRFYFSVLCYLPHPHRRPPLFFLPTPLLSTKSTSRRKETSLSHLRFDVDVSFPSQRILHGPRAIATGRGGVREGVRGRRQ